MGSVFKGFTDMGFFLHKILANKLSFQAANVFATLMQNWPVWHTQGFTLYGMVPKAHAFAHIYHGLEISTGPATCNPALYDCSMDEDFVGQVARQSRRVSYRHTVQNTLLAYKVKARLVIQRFKKKTSDVSIP